MEEHIWCCGLCQVEVTYPRQFPFAVLPHVLYRVQVRAVRWQADQVDVELAAMPDQCPGPVDGRIVKDDPDRPPVVVQAPDVLHELHEVAGPGLPDGPDAIVAVERHETEQGLGAPATALAIPPARRGEHPGTVGAVLDGGTVEEAQGRIRVQLEEGPYFFLSCPSASAGRLSLTMKGLP